MESCHMLWLPVANACSANVKPIAKIVEKYHKPFVFIKIIRCLNFCLSSFNVFPSPIPSPPPSCLPPAGASALSRICRSPPVGMGRPRSLRWAGCRFGRDVRGVLRHMASFSGNAPQSVMRPLSFRSWLLVGAFCRLSSACRHLARLFALTQAAVPSAPRQSVRPAVRDDPPGR